MLIHFAAQSLVRESYRNPKYTFEVNVLGTLNVLQVLETRNSYSAALIITTDKVYLNDNENRPFIESDPLRGAEPYGASKAIADEMSQYWIQNDFLNVFSNHNNLNLKKIHFHIHQLISIKSNKNL